MTDTEKIVVEHQKKIPPTDTAEDTGRYLEGSPVSQRNREVEKIIDLYEEVARSPNPIKTLEKIIGTDKDPLPKRVSSEWIQKMEEHLRSNDQRLAETGNVALTWYLMRQIPLFYAELKALDLDPSEFFSLCVTSIQRTLADKTKPMSGSKEETTYNLYTRGRINMRLYLRRHLTEHYAIKLAQMPDLLAGAEQYKHVARLYYIMYGKTPNPEDALVLAELARIAEEEGLEKEKIGLYVAKESGEHATIPLGGLVSKQAVPGQEEGGVYDKVSFNAMKEDVREALNSLAVTHPRWVLLLIQYFDIDVGPEVLSKITETVGLGSLKQVSRRRIAQLKDGAYTRIRYEHPSLADYLH